MSDGWIIKSRQLSILFFLPSTKKKKKSLNLFYCSLMLNNNFIKKKIIKLVYKKSLILVSKWAIRIRISKKNRQDNGQKKKDKRTNNDQQNIHIRLKIE